MSKWLKKDDKVVVISGNEKGRVGKILSRKGDKVIVQGLNIRKKHMKRRSQETRAEIVDMECPIHISNVSACNDEEKPVRLKAGTNKEGLKEIYFLEKGNAVVYREAVKSKK